MLLPCRRVVHGSILCDPIQPNPWTTLPCRTLRALRVRLSACLSVGHSRELQTRLNRSRCSLGGETRVDP